MSCRGNVRCQQEIWFLSAELGGQAELITAPHTHWRHSTEKYVYPAEVGPWWDSADVIHHQLQLC